MANYLDLARSQLGMNEVQQRAALSDYLSTGGARLDPATLAWCAAFVNSSLARAGLPGTGSNMARSFLDYGTPVAPADVRPGDIAVYARGTGPYGHVGFVNSVDPAAGSIGLLAGNQGNAVSVRNYPIGTALGFRRPGETDQPATGVGPVLASDLFGNRVEASGLMDVPQVGAAPPMTPERFVMGMIAGENPLRAMVFNRIAGMFG